jgi:hypothetical protein
VGVATKDELGRAAKRGQKRTFTVIWVQSTPQGWKGWWGGVALGGNWKGDEKRSIYC